MRSATFLPRPELRPYVQLIWCFETEGEEEPGPPERIAPDGIVELVVHHHGATSVRWAHDALSAMPGSSLVCQGVRYLDIHPGGPAGFVSVRFHPWGAMHFFDAPVDELSDRVVPAELVWGPEGGQLAQRLAEAGGRRARVAIVESWLRGRLRLFERPDVEGALRAVWRSGGRVSIPTLCHDLGLTERTAQRLFRRSVGMPPKRYVRLVRFLTACSMMRRTDFRSLGEVGHRCGYYDQAHFNDDFRSFSGLTPGEFARSSSVSFLEIG